MNVLLFIVNYRSDGPLQKCVASVQHAALSSTFNLQIHVVDNSEYPGDKLTALKQMLSEFTQIPVRLHLPENNTGYFGCFPLAQELAKMQGCNVVIYSNPDVRFAPDFFDQLAIKRLTAPGLLAPAITSSADGFDQNPKYIHRLDRVKLQRLQRIYSLPLGFNLYMGLARLKERMFGRKARSAVPAGQFIYAPHGAVLVFTDTKFFCSLPRYPCFLFGEELFVGEEAKMRGVNITYQPALQVEDLRSQSVRQLPGELHRSLMLSSIGYILTRYYEAS